MAICCKFRLGYDCGASKPSPYGWNIDPKKNKMPGSNSEPSLQKKPDKVSTMNKMPGSNSGPGLQKKPDKVSAYEKKAACREQACLFLESMVLTAGLDPTNQTTRTTIVGRRRGACRNGRLRLQWWLASGSRR